MGGGEEEGGGERRRGVGGGGLGGACERHTFCDLGGWEGHACSRLCLHQTYPDCGSPAMRLPNSPKM